MGNLKGYTVFIKSLGQTAPSAWKCPKTQFWGPLTSWKLNPLQGPTHTLTSSSINKQNRSKNYLWIYHSMHWTLYYKSKTVPCVITKQNVWQWRISANFPYLKYLCVTFSHSTTRLLLCEITYNYSICHSFPKLVDWGLKSYFYHSTASQETTSPAKEPLHSLELCKWTRTYWH